jgi:tetratricopeptide (TPR) repeat protein
MAKKVSIKKLVRTNDAFLTTSDKIWNYVQGNKKKIIIWASALVAIFLIVIIVKSVHDSKLENALAAYQQAITITSIEPQKEALIQVRTDYAGTPADRLAAYALLDLALTTNSFDEAVTLGEQLLQSLPKAEEHVRPLLMETLGGLYEEKGQPSEALAQYKAAITLVEPLAARPEGNASANAYLSGLYTSLSRVALATGQIDEARVALENIIFRAPNTQQAFQAQIKLASIEPVPTASDEATSTETPADADASASTDPATEGSNSSTGSTSTTPENSSADTADTTTSSDSTASEDTAETTDAPEDATEAPADTTETPADTTEEAAQ